MVGVKERKRAKDEMNLGKLLLSEVNAQQSSGGGVGVALLSALRNCLQPQGGSTFRTRTNAALSQTKKCETHKKKVLLVRKQK